MRRKATSRPSSGTGAKVTLAALILPVRNVLTDSIIDPGEVIPSLDELLAQIASMEQLEDEVSAAESARVSAEQQRVAAENERAALGFSVVDGALCVTYNEQEEAT